MQRQINIRSNRSSVAFRRNRKLLHSDLSLFGNILFCCVLNRHAEDSLPAGETLLTGENGAVRQLLYLILRKRAAKNLFAVFFCRFFIHFCIISLCAGCNANRKGLLKKRQRTFRPLFLIVTLRLVRKRKRYFETKAIEKPALRYFSGFLFCHLV